MQQRQMRYAKDVERRDKSHHSDDAHLPKAKGGDDVLMMELMTLQRKRNSVAGNGIYK